MLKSASHMKDLTISAADGQIGSVEEFYFDDEAWTLRYLIVNTGNWLSGRRVLISPVFLSETDWENKRLCLGLTKTQIENSPGIDTHKPVSRQQEADYLSSLGAAYYWGGSDVWGMAPFPAGLAGAALPMEPRADLARGRETADSHLRSSAAVTGYRIAATDGEIGHVADFIVDQDTWAIHYLDVSTRNWLPGKRVLIAPEWVEKVSWLESEVYVDLTRETIQTAPEYIESQPITRAYENQLHEHYGRPPYWLGHGRGRFHRMQPAQPV